MSRRKSGNVDGVDRQARKTSSHWPTNEMDSGLTRQPVTSVLYLTLLYGQGLFVRGKPFDKLRTSPGRYTVAPGFMPGELCDATPAVRSIPADR